MAIVQINNVSFRYPSGEGLFSVNMKINAGDFIYLIGPSGAGKSTLLKLIYMDIMPMRGHVVFEKYNTMHLKKSKIPLLRRRIGIVFQDFKLFNDRSVYDNIAFVLEVTGTKKNDIKRKVLRVLTEVGLNHKRSKMPLQLSGGEQQRVAIARALVNDPVILLADEPTGNLDPEAAQDILQLLEKLNINGTAILMATHNEKLAKGGNKRVVNIKHGKLI